jgi:hypothetical protein
MLKMADVLTSPTPVRQDTRFRDYGCSERWAVLQEVSLC